MRLTPSTEHNDAFLLGAGDAKVGQIIGGSVKDGKEVKLRFVNNFPGLKTLMDNLEAQIKRTGRIRLIDGTPLLVPEPYTRLGYLLQGDENRIMKNAARLVHISNMKKKLDVLKVGDIHDEWQSDVLIPHIEEYIINCNNAFAETQKMFNYRVALECDHKVGMTWAETH